jgi:hypothetical protein
METDRLERKFLSNKLEKSLLPISHRPVYTIDDGQVLYRQFNEGIGFVFPNISEYAKAVRGKTYYQVNIQPTDDQNSLLLPDSGYMRIAVAFSLNPVSAYEFRRDILKEITEYEPFEGNRFYLLKDSSVVMLRARTSSLNDGEWFCSLQDFDFFYYVFSGKDRPEAR